MYSRLLTLCTFSVALAGCSFDEAGVGTIDAGGGVVDAATNDGQAAVADASSADAAVTDAAPGIDGPVDASLPPDAPVPDGPLPPPDGPLPDAPPVIYTVVDTITVECDGTEVTSSVTLSAVVTYRLRMSGSCTIGGGGSVQADAEYFNFASPQDATTGMGAFDVGVGIDDTVVDLVKPPDWGAYTATHIYEVEFPGTGATITAKFYDGNYANNSGSLTLEVLAPN